MSVIRVEHAAAKDLALELFSFSLAVMPRLWQPVMAEKIVQTAVRFALHARRLTEALGLLNMLGADYALYKASLSESCDVTGLLAGETIIYENNFTFCLNSLIHSRKITLGWINCSGDNSPFSIDVGPAIGQRLIVMTDDGRGWKNLSLHGISFFYLTAINSSVKLTAPWAALDSSGLNFNLIDGVYHLIGGPIS